MIEFVSKLPLKKMTCQQFHEFVSSVVSVPSFPVSAMTQTSNGYILCHDDTLAYHFSESSIVDVIFYEKTSEVMLCFDQRDTGDCFDLLEKMFDHDLFELDKDIKIQRIAHYQFSDSESDYLPCLVVKDGAISKKRLQSCAELLKGMAHVMVRDNNISNDAQIKLFRQVLQFDRLDDESETSFVKRIVQRIKTTMNKQVFEMPFNMNCLYQHVLSFCISKAKEEESELLETADDQLNTLEKEKQKVIEQIESMSWQIDQLTHQVEVLQMRCNTKGQFPIITKGQEKEKYPGEQKDMVLSLIVEELKTEKDPELIGLYHEILKENPEVGNRRKMLDEIFKILVSNSRIDEKVCTDLKQFGIELEKKSENHFKGCFFSDTRYLTSLSSTPSDTNAGRQMFRDFRKFYF